MNPIRTAFTLKNGRTIGGNASVFIVAEIGVNHDGDINKALTLVDSVAESGADAVKVQLLTPEANYAKGHPSYDIFKNVGLEVSLFRKVQEHALSRGLTFFATPDTPSLSLVSEWEMPLIKISSGMITDKPHIEMAARQKVPIVFSSGMSYLHEVATTIKWASDCGASDIGFLHCTSLYPAPEDSLNLRAILGISELGVVAGYSDHSVGHLASVTAVGLGAKILEKHVTLDNAAQGPEHHFAADPTSFKEYVSAIRSVERMLGSGKKEPTETEEKNRLIFRRCLVAVSDLYSGDILTDHKVGVLRPNLGTVGMAPEYLDKIIGKTLKRAVLQGNGITLDDLVDPGHKT